MADDQKRDPFSEDVTRDTRIDPSVKEMLEGAKYKGLTEAQKRKRLADDARTKKTIDTDPNLAALIDALAAERRISTSGLWSLLAFKGFQALQDGEYELNPYLEPSNSPRIDSVVNYAKELRDFIKSMKNSAKKRKPR